MSEPSSAASAASAMAGVGLAMYLPGIDGNALLGGFGGAIFFVVFARDYNALTRLGYLLVSWVGGLRRNRGARPRVDPDQRHGRLRRRDPVRDRRHRHARVDAWR